MRVGLKLVVNRRQVALIVRRRRLAESDHEEPGAGFGRNPMGGRGSCRAAESMRVPTSRLGGSLALPRNNFAAREETKRS